jgi:hypothetical protein
VLNPDDRAEHFRSEAWQAGCYFWRISRNLDLDDVLKNRQLDDTMREAGDLARRRYSDLVCSGAPIDHAFVTTRGELEGKYGNGTLIAPFLPGETLAVPPTTTIMGQPVPAGGLMRRLGIQAVAK